MVDSCTLCMWIKGGALASACALQRWPQTSPPAPPAPATKQTISQPQHDGNHVAKTKDCTLGSRIKFRANRRKWETVHRHPPNTLGVLERSRLCLLFDPLRADRCRRMGRSDGVVRRSQKCIYRDTILTQSKGTRANRVARSILALRDVALKTRPRYWTCVAENTTHT